MPAWTFEQIPDLSGRTAIVTGANTGLGLVTARELAAAGARVILACRDTAKGKAAASTIGGDVEVRSLDLASLDAVRRFAGGVEEPISLLINNAGLFAFHKKLTMDGFERQFGVNHLGHFALTGLLLDRITGRVVTVASLAHSRARIRLKDPNWPRGYIGSFAYGQSKLANLMFALELQRRLAAVDSPVESMAAHPGYAATGLSRRFGPVVNVLGAALDAVMAQSVDQGALPILYAAAEPDLPGGCYIGPDGLGEFRGYPRVAGMSRRAQDPQVQRTLWELSEELTGVRYNFQRGVR
jgi:NAD(P)-dependent dehydrogenase (short-subunit alcohol dehydrogenase family)